MQPDVQKNLENKKSCAKYVSVFLNTNRFKNPSNYYNDFKSMTFDVSTNDTMEIIERSKKILNNIYKEGVNYKKAGVILGDIVPENKVQLHLFSSSKKYTKIKNLFDSIDIINQKMGRDTVKFLSQGYPKDKS